MVILGTAGPRLPKVAVLHAGLNETVPGGLLRFLLLVNFTSNVDPDVFRLMAVKVGSLLPKTPLLESKTVILLQRVLDGDVPQAQVLMACDGISGHHTAGAGVLDTA